MSDFSAIIPAALLTLGILGVIIADLLAKGRRPHVPIGIAIASMAAAGLYALRLEPSDQLVLGVMRADNFGILWTVFCCATGIVTVLATMRGEAFRTPGGEFLTLVVASVLGMSVLAMATDLVMLYLAFETVSVPAYVLVGMRRADLRATEASMKYVLFGAVSSAFMLYGLSMLVGLAGSTSLEALGVAIGNGAATQPMFYVAATFMLAGFAFKISAVPFHFWAPDVYAGAPASVGGFLAVASKAAGFAALVRVVMVASPGAVVNPDPTGGLLPQAAAGQSSFLLELIAVIAILTALFGNFAALRQRDIKRLLAWSSIAHAGYILMALAVWSPDNETAIPALVFYLVAYLFMNLAAFFIAGIAIREVGTSDIQAFRGLGRRSVWLAVAFTLVLFSLTGLPPFFGFIAKYHVFYAVFEKQYVWLGVVGLLAGVISLYYYARIVALMFPFSVEDEATGGSTPKPMRLAWSDYALTAVLVLPVLVFGLFWGGLWEWARTAIPAVIGG